MDANVLVLNGIDSVADGPRTMRNPRESHDTTSRPASKCLLRVLNKSVVRHTEYKCNTCSVRRESVVECIRRKCHVCNLRGSHLSQSARILETTSMSCAAVNFSLVKDSSSLCHLLTIFLNYERTVLSFSDKRCGKLPNESNGHFHAPRKIVEQVVYCCKSTRHDSSSSRVGSLCRTISPHRDGLQASMRQCAANKFQFLSYIPAFVARVRCPENT